MWGFFILIRTEFSHSNLPKQSEIFKRKCHTAVAESEYCADSVSLLFLSGAFWREGCKGEKDLILFCLGQKYILFLCNEKIKFVIKKK